MNVREKLAILPTITIEDVTGIPVEVHEMYNNSGYIIAIKTGDDLKLKTISYTYAEILIGEQK